MGFRTVGGTEDVVAGAETAAEGEAAPRSNTP
jgi:hypothetical protein